MAYGIKKLCERPKKSYIENILKLCEETYPKKHCEQLKSCYAKNEETYFVFVEGSKGLTGYINFFLISDNDFNDIMQKNDIPVDNISPVKITKRENGDEANRHFFIRSIACCDKDAANALSKGWVEYLNEIVDENNLIVSKIIPVRKQSCLNAYENKLSEEKFGMKQEILNTYIDISCISVSNAEEEFLRKHWFFQKRHLVNDDKVDKILCFCNDNDKQDDSFIKKLLNNKLYVKTHKDDVYLMLPFVYENDKTDFFNKLCSNQPKCNIPEDAKNLIDGLNECIKYECENEVKDYLRISYLDTFNFLHTIDDYYGDTEDIIIGEEKVHCILTSHPNTHMHILTMLITNCKFSTSQIADQMSSGYLKIRNPKHENRFKKIEDYLNEKYDLIHCGENKMLLCMSNLPKDEVEFLCIMGAQTRNSFFQTYYIEKSCCEAQKWKVNHTKYDAYDVFLSDSVVVQIPKEFDYDSFDSDNTKDRIEFLSTYSFIALLTMFQNTALERNNRKVSRALSKGRKLSNRDALELYRKYGKTMQFWEINNYKYIGAQLEANCITKAWGNAELKAVYEEQQKFLDKIIELQAEQSEKRSNLWLNVMLAILTFIQSREIIMKVIEKFCNWNESGELFWGDLKESSNSANHAYALIVTGGIILLIIIRKIIKKRYEKIQKENLLLKSKQESKEKRK